MKRKYKNEYGRLIDVATGVQIPPSPAGYWGELPENVRAEIVHDMRDMWTEADLLHEPMNAGEDGVE